MSHSLPQWQGEMKTILNKQFKGKKSPRKQDIVAKLIHMTEKVDVPDGEIGQVIAQILVIASEDLHPRAAAYAGFQLGVACEQYQHQ